MSVELEKRTKQIQTQKRPKIGWAPEVVVPPVPNLTTIFVSEGISNRLRPTERVQFTTQEGQRVSFKATSEGGKELVERVVTRIFRQYKSQTDWKSLAEQVQSLSPAFSPLRKEFRAQIEVAEALFSGPVPQAACVASIATFFAANRERFVRTEKTDGNEIVSRKLNANGKRFAEATYQWLGRLFPETSLEELKAIIDENLGNVSQTGLLKQSLKGKINWEKRQRQYLALEQQDPEELFKPCYYNELQKELQGAARFEYELKLAIEKVENKLGRKVDAQVEVQAFESVLEAEAKTLEAENEEEIEAITQEQPRGFRARVKTSWNRFTDWFVREKGYRKVVLATVSAISLGVVLATCAGIPQRLFSQGPLLPDRPQPDPPPEPRPELKAAQDKAERQKFQILTQDVLVRNQDQSESQEAKDQASQSLEAITANQMAQAEIAQLAQASQREQGKTEKKKSQETALSAMNQSISGVLFEANQEEKEEEKPRRQGPPPPMNPTPEPTKTQEKIWAQAEPTLTIKGIPHNADLDPDAGVFEARGTWVDLDESGRLPDPPKDKVSLYDVGFLYGQTADGKAELVASEGDIHAYIHNAQRWAEAGWPKWRDWLSLAFDQGGVKIGDIIKFGGAKYKIAHIHPVDPNSMLVDLFAPTKEFMGRRLVISTCSTPPEGVYTSSTDLGLPRQVVTAVLAEPEAVSA